MKFVTQTGGLGNQLFGFAFCMELRQRGFKAVLFKPYPDKSKYYGHQGYELSKLFNVKKYDGTYSRFATLLLTIYTYIIKIVPPRFRLRLYKMIGVYTVSVPENFIYYPEVFNFEHTNQLFRGTWQSEQYFKHAVAEVRNSLTFNPSLLSAKTAEMKQSIRTSNSVSIHIRRGDYLSDQYANGFAGVCTMDYYNKAIEYIKSKVGEPHFYVFTDDPEWVTKNFLIKNATYVQNNAGDNSWQDMYLMSQCKHNIIANSSFSWWAAWLNANTNKIVIAPKKWWRLFDRDDVVPNEWIRM
jgi:hypothetical protein